MGEAHNNNRHPQPRTKIRPLIPAPVNPHITTPRPPRQQPRRGCYGIIMSGNPPFVPFVVMIAPLPLGAGCAGPERKGGGMWGWVFWSQGRLLCNQPWALKITTPLGLLVRQG